MEIDKEIRDLKRRMELAETKISQHAGQFEFITGQLRDVQLYLHARFDDVDKKLADVDKKLAAHDARFDRLDAKVDRLEAKVEALPKAIAEIIGRK